jgi:CheY-like chemotaxis protein
MVHPETEASPGRAGDVKVLVVEDNYLVADLLREMLETCGCEVVGPFPSAEKAIQQVESQALDGAVLDVNLGGTMSFEVAKALRARDIPFVFATGYDQGTLFPQELGTVQRLTKPFDLDTLQRVVDTTFRHA